jgi:hypothetical protein
VFKKSLAVAAGSLGLLASSAGMACADTGGIGGEVTTITGDQSGLINVNAPLVDLRCATPWFGSAVLGVSLPIGSENVVCDDVKAPIAQAHVGNNSLL